jgi:hypothetical protein
VRGARVNNARTACACQFKVAFTTAILMPRSAFIEQAI